MPRVSGKQDNDKQLAQLGAAVRIIRKEAGLSQEALADASNVDRSHMGKIERGERNLTFLNIARIASALGLRSSELLSRAGL